MSAGLSHVARPPAAAAAGALVLLHGRGADERDLAPLLDLLDPERRLLGLLPRGPLTLPPGGAHWYVVREIGFPDPATFLPTNEQAGAWLDDALAEAGIPPERAVLGGFSQGAVMSYALGLGAGRPRPAAILAMSGFVPRVAGFDLDLESRAGLPVSVSHGTYDPIIEVGFGREARERLETAGLDVAYREDPVAHQISPGALAQAQAVLESALGP
ncbi:MAG: alpha/beta hydrolase [Gaiellaceae bacterium]